MYDFSRNPNQRFRENECYIEYNFEIQDRNFTKPIPIKVHPHDVKIFKGMPKSITDRIEEVKKVISDYSNQN